MKNQARIKVVGIGGSGGNAISRMAKCHIQGIELIAINSDFQDLKKIKADKKVHIGIGLTQGFGAGMDPAIGEKAAIDSLNEIKEVLQQGDIVFVTCGLGGGTGSGAVSVIADLAKNLGSLTIGVVTLPFTFEGEQRKKIAKGALEKLKDKVDTLFVISNNKLLNAIDEKTSLNDAFWKADEVLRQAVQGISDLIVRPGLINVNFADLKSIMKDAGFALFGVGKAKGENKVKEAAHKAINSPLLDLSTSKGAHGILFNITGGKNLTLNDVEEAGKIITQNAANGAKIIFGAIQDEKKFADDEVEITVIATGIEK
ncbi:MAG: cell division protein FtsZ [Candidatus Pacebacteria bacterium]|nr:cell division protein FtsZ [Candidatus Paceibacterota bacterium]